MTRTLFSKSALSLAACLYCSSELLLSMAHHYLS